MNTDAKIVMKIDNLISMLEKVPADKVIMVPKETIDALAELVKDEESDDEELEDEHFKCDRCKAVKHCDHYITLNNDHSGNTICDECIPEYVKENGLEEDSDDEEEETPTCGFCGRDAGHSPIEHPKWDELYFCSEKCFKDYE